MVNGCPGPWFTYRRGLRQGDPLSPYLILIIADVLQKLIQAYGCVAHPLVAGAPCPVLQYADDTLNVTRVDAASVSRLRSLLDNFANATKLNINYSKSSVVPLHADPLIVAQCFDVLQCKTETFPQIYLVLPPSPHKIKTAALLPMIMRADKYLAGWKASLLNTMGRAVLTDAVLVTPDFPDETNCIPICMPRSSFMHIVTYK
jgi:hypothetical protein